VMVVVPIDYSVSELVELSPEWSFCHRAV